MRIATISNDPNTVTNGTNDIRIDQRFTASTVRQASRFDYRFGTDVVDVRVGVFPRQGLDSGYTHVAASILTLTVPMRRLLNGRKPDCIRTIRFNHLLNIVTSWASETHGVDLSANNVVFLGFSR
jgi:hypothetical protein